MKNKINIEQYLSAMRYTTRKELTEKTGLADREVRTQISKLREKRVVISNSYRSGYKLAREYRSMSRIERKEEKEQIRHSLNSKKSRIKSMKKQMRKEIAYLKKAEQIDLEEENDSHIPYID